MPAVEPNNFRLLTEAPSPPASNSKAGKVGPYLEESLQPPYNKLLVGQRWFPLDHVASKDRPVYQTPISHPNILLEHEPLNPQGSDIISDSGPIGSHEVPRTSSTLLQTLR